MELSAIRDRVTRQLERLPGTFNISPDANALWHEWYLALPESVHAKRLDTIGFRLMAILALTMDKDAVDLEVVEAAVMILNYELAIRTATDPIDANGLIAKLEERIRRQLKVKRPLMDRDLRRHAHGDREGIWAFEQAKKNLIHVGDVEKDTATGKYRLIAPK
jgi:hypothetical protein